MGLLSAASCSKIVAAATLLSEPPSDHKLTPTSLTDTIVIDLKRADHAKLLPSCWSPPPHLHHHTLSRLLRRDLQSDHRFPAALCNAADTLITCLLSPHHHHQLHPSVDPAVQLTRNSFPVLETPPTPCQVFGDLPPDLCGVYLRNGPNATLLHRGEGYHFFDGDGMLQSVRFHQGSASFCARYVKTSRYQQEEAAGRPLIPRFFGAGSTLWARAAVTLLRAILGCVDLSQGWGLCNTSVAFFNGQVLAMSEDDMPYVIKVTNSGDLLTQGRWKLSEKMKIMCAHPKFDPNTGDMFAFHTSLPFMPFFKIFSVTADGKKSPDVSVPLYDLPLVHDFAITRRYVMFPDSQLVIRPIGREGFVTMDSGKVSRFCVLPRGVPQEEAANKARWFEVPGCNCLHYINAWEGDEEIVIIAPVLSTPENILKFGAVDTSVTVSEIRLNTTTGRASCRKVCVGTFELGTLNPRYVGQKSRYIYLANGYKFPEGVIGAVKVDLEDGRIVAQRTYNEGCYGGEPLFVPRKASTMEDDGYLLSFVYNKDTKLSELLVMDALSPCLEVLASIQLPTRVPYGLHGCFVSEEQLLMQQSD